MKDPRTLPGVAVLATLDTKAEEAGLVCAHLARQGVRPVLVDIGLGGTPQCAADISREHLVELAGPSHQGTQAPSDTGTALAAHAQAVARVITVLHGSGEIEAALGLGGGKGSHLSAPALRSLPFGVPKVLVSTICARTGQQLVGTSDLMLVPTVADLHGVNHITRSVLLRAASAVAGMITASGTTDGAENHREPPAAALTALGATAPAVEGCMAGLRQRGFEPVVFHSNGTGGRSMEALVEANQFQAMIDVTTSEIANELFGGHAAAGPDRGMAAITAQVPLVVAPGGLDMLIFPSHEAIPEPLRDRARHEHTPTAVLVRTSAEENERAGRHLVAQLNRSPARVTLLIPGQGFSAYDRAGQPFHDPECVAAFRHGAQAAAAPDLRVELIDAHINDQEFILGLLTALDELLPTDRSTST